MNRVTLFGAFSMALGLTLGHFAYQFLMDAPNWIVAAERSFFQAFALLIAWFCWREPREKTYRRGQWPGFCD